jgi:hypothetical protein
MTRKNRLSAQTRKNWLIDATVFLGATVAMLSGLYFLLLPSAGYEGGRNPTYGITFLFTRPTWHDFHAWGGLLMITAVVVHLIIHWQWIKMMASRVFKTVCQPGCRFSKGAKVNLITDILIAVSFFTTSLSGLYLFLLPEGGYQGGRHQGWDPGLIFPRLTWRSIHNWSGIMLVITAIIHIWIHRRWITKVTKKFFHSIGPLHPAQA